MGRTWDNIKEDHDSGGANRMKHKSLDIWTKGKNKNASFVQKTKYFYKKNFSFIWFAMK